MRERRKNFLKKVTSFENGFFPKITYLFFIAFIMLIFQTLLHTTDTIDSWYLAGILWYFIPFILLFSLAVVFSFSVKYVTFLSSIFLTTIVLIPNLKYGFILGSGDSMLHYGCIKEAIIQGHTAPISIYATQYASTPGLHILIAILSIITNTNIVTSIKIFLTVSSALLPLITYLVVRNLDLPNDISKYTILVSSVAFACPLTYLFVGTSAIQVFFVPFIYLMFLSFLTKRVFPLYIYFIIIGIFGLVILFSHDATSLYLTMLMGIILAFLAIERTFKLRENKGTSSFVLPLLWLLIYLTHFLYFSEFNLTDFVLTIKNTMAPLFKAESSTFLHYSTYFKLSLVGKMNILIVNYVKDAILMLTSLLGIWLILRKKIKFIASNIRGFYYRMSLIVIISLLVFGVTFLEWRPFSSRLVRYTQFTFPFLSGITLSYFLHKISSLSFGRILVSLLLFGLICVSFLQIYPYQPLIPGFHTNYRHYYVQEHRLVVPVYARSAVSFINTYNKDLSIAADSGTDKIMYGLINSSNRELINDEDPVFSKKVRSSLIVLSISSANRIIYEQSSTYENFFLKMKRIRSSIYANGEYYIFTG